MNMIQKAIRLPSIPKAPKRPRVAAYDMFSIGKDAMLHSLASQVNAYSSQILANHHENKRVSTLTKSSPARRRRGRDCRG